MHMEIRGAEKLSFREKQVVSLRESGVSVEEIAKRLQIGVSSVSTLYQRARSKGYQTVIVIPGEILEGSRMDLEAENE